MQEVIETSATIGHEAYFSCSDCGPGGDLIAQPAMLSPEALEAFMEQNDYEQTYCADSTLILDIKQCEEACGCSDNMPYTCERHVFYFPSEEALAMFAQQNYLKLHAG